VDSNACVCLNVVFKSLHCVDVYILYLFLCIVHKIEIIKQRVFRCVCVWEDVRMV